MNATVKSLIRRCLPERIWTRLVESRRVQYSETYPTWAAAAAHAQGYHTPVILDRVTAATREVVAGRAAYERDSILFHETTPDPVIIAALTLDLPPDQPLRVLDFGGALGGSYHQHRRHLPDSRRIVWNIVEQPHYVARGQAEFQTAELRFHRTIQDAGSPGPPHVVLLASVLQYLENPWETLATVARLPATTWIVDRTPFHEGDHDLPILQRVPACIYPASYPAWILSSSKFTEFWRKNNVSLTWHPTPEGEIQRGGLSFTFRSAVCHPSESAIRTHGGAPLG